MATVNADAPSPHSRVEVLGNIGPNWFASVMGTGIVATVGAALPSPWAFGCPGPAGTRP